MKKTLSKLLALLLVLILAISLFSSCKSGKDNDPVDKQPNDQQGDEQGDETDDDEEVPEVSIDLGGADFRIAQWWDEQPAPGTPRADRLIELGEKYNCNIVYLNVAADEYYQKFTAGVLSGTPESDLTLLRSRWVPASMRKGLCYDLTGLIDLNDDVHYNRSIMEAMGSLDGRIYCIFPAPHNVWPNNILLFNKALAEREGITNLYEMEKNKTWTFNKLQELALKATKDTDGDGEIDQWGISGINAMQLIYSNGGEMTRPEGDTVKLAFDSPQSIEALSFFADLHLKHKVVGGDGLETFQAGKSLFQGAPMYQLAGIMESMTDHYGLIHYPLGPSGKDYNNVTVEVQMYVVPACSKIPNETIEIFERIFDPFPSEDDTPPPTRVESVSHLCYDDESAQILARMHDETMVFTDYGAWDGWSWGINEMFGRVARGEETPQAAVDAIKAEMQAGIDSVLNS